ncbi:lsm domain protein [Cystoisospora suis]|uniref:Lsm domain protein n=1 Tax=Cystoisospora suis TaxID=483139 RepID=A0A2C6KJQ7_9APIC|nr:lsm domain protein [Cystoisospora suis]
MPTSGLASFALAYDVLHGNSMAPKRSVACLKAPFDSVLRGADPKRPKCSIPSELDFLSPEFDPQAALRDPDLKPPVESACAVANVRMAEMLLPWGLQEHMAGLLGNVRGQADGGPQNLSKRFEDNLKVAKNKQFRKDMEAAVAASKAQAARVGEYIEQRFTGGISKAHGGEEIVESLRRWTAAGTQVKVHVHCRDLLPGIGGDGCRAMLAGAVRWFDEKLNLLLQPARLLVPDSQTGSARGTEENDGNLGWVYVRCHQIVSIAPLGQEAS